ncbi:putative HAUS augmin-like complex subunit 4 [Monocercomonoides exilis]|uniref:putative HAUS augmin-like complex subunit 4 n=1 Tax=Monocercomonoides exilis TaxID=2049356 RepID=UPI003559A72E|nr:putative HAUS augmin-like complex subunit 4 [Monocercomonoides exilis]|eukprot:MONOS_13213.1-p1 / transcript=MONOS_13213.1 / gene=MONOS_13213 / organism=Monocercomonoides_exilis_PA203 / gene_product=unspecified product / transcript_product=unspecified product / location=Mono_scaffold00792:6303-7509(+) / protein_length=293 / sequence_SO=supercontig / SO=protein_coding / is_pseudo=false
MSSYEEIKKTLFLSKVKYFKKVLLLNEAKTLVLRGSLASRTTESSSLLIDDALLRADILQTVCASDKIESSDGLHPAPFAQTKDDILELLGDSKQQETSKENIKIMLTKALIESFSEKLASLMKSSVVSELNNTKTPTTFTEFQEVITQSKIKNQQFYSEMLNSEKLTYKTFWGLTEALCKMLATEIEVLEKKIEKIRYAYYESTYNPETISVLSSIQKQVSSDITFAEAEIGRMKGQLTVYHSVGLGFPEMVKTYSELVKKYKQNQWTLTHLQIGMEEDIEKEETKKMDVET